MAYTAENISNIKRDGNLENYIAHERELIANLAGAEVEFGKQGRDTASIAHLTGRYDIHIEDNVAVAWINDGTAWDKQWSLKNFGGDQQQALAYAKGALASELKAVAAKVASEARVRLAALDAAQ